jgi:serine/threonine-protein kinase
VDAQQTDTPVRPGDVVAGKYRVERLIGSGGMGIVVAAHHLALDEPVALKFLRPHQSENREVVERLMREARATFRLRNVHSVRVHDVGELPEGPLYIVMELLEGRDLRAELDARGALPLREVVSHGLDICEALEEAHALGIVHRDLKPGNLFLARTVGGRDIVKILDFGMSKLDPALTENGPITRPETALGTPRYMAPEQWKSASTVDPAADIWAVGAVMYELLTGKVPLKELGLVERQARLQAGAIPSPREIRPEVPEALARVVLRCLRADPRARWSSASSLAGALRTAFPEIDEVEQDPDAITKTGVTVVVPPEIQARQAALAFDPADAPRLTAPPATRPDSPQARGTPVPSSETPALPRSPFPLDEEFDAKTEVSAPLFTPAPVPARAIVPSRNAPAGGRPKPMTATLRSFENPSDVVDPAVPREETLRLPGAPLRPGTVPTAMPIPGPARAVSAPSFEPAIAPVRPPQLGKPSLQSPRQTTRSNVALYVVLSLLAAIVLSAFVTWLAMRAG